MNPAPRLFHRPPSPALAPYVETLWACVAPGLPHRRERHLPSPEVQIIVNLDADRLSWDDGPRFERRHRLPGAAVSGPFDRPIGLDTRDQRRVVGAVLRPGVGPAVLGVPLEAVAGTHVPLDELPRFADLRLRLLEAPPGRVLATFDARLTARLAPGPHDRAMRAACRALDRGAAVAAVAEAQGISPRTLRRRFAAAVGLTPRRYGRLIRFQRAVARIAAGPISDWAGLAVELGYFDQAHFVRDFRAFAGVTPSAWHPRSMSDANHAPM